VEAPGREAWQGSRQLQTTTTVTNEAEFQAAIVSGAHIILNNDITLTTAITIGADITDLKISSLKGDGTNAVLNGGGSTRIFDIGSGAAVVLEGLDLENGKGPSFGGCVHNDGGDLQIEASNFRDCVATGDYGEGGGIASDGGSVKTTDTTFTDCSAKWGGGIRSWGGSLTTTGTTFTSCSADVSN